MGKDRKRREKVLCPLGRILLDVEKAFGKNPSFHEHMGRSRLEFLKAVRSLLDQKIEDLEEKGHGMKRKTAHKIDVE